MNLYILYSITVKYTFINILLLKAQYILPPRYYPKWG